MWEFFSTKPETDENVLLRWGNEFKAMLWKKDMEANDRKNNELAVAKKGQGNSEFWTPAERNYNLAKEQMESLEGFSNKDKSENNSEERVIFKK